MDIGSFKDLESLHIKATYNLKIGNREFEPGETIAYIEKVQMSGLQEHAQMITAHGGFEDRNRVFWEVSHDVTFSFINGVFSKEQFALMANSRMLEKAPEEVVKISQREYVESDENGILTLKYAPAHDIYVYDKETGKKLTFTQNEKELTIYTKDEHDQDVPYPYRDTIVDYGFDYAGDTQVVMIGRRLVNGFLELEGRTRVKDDTTGQIVTGIIRIPHFKLMSDLSIRLGTQAHPIISSFKGIGVPVGSRNSAYVCEFYYLSDDIGSDL